MTGKFSQTSGKIITVKSFSILLFTLVKNAITSHILRYKAIIKSDFIVIAELRFNNRAHFFLPLYQK